MRKRTIVLERQDRKPEPELAIEYLQTAIPMKLDIQEILLYPYEMPYLDIDKFYEYVTKSNAEAFIVDPEFILADVYHDGKLVEKFRENELSVFLKGTTIDLVESQYTMEEIGAHEVKEDIRKELDNYMKEKELPTLVINDVNSKMSMLEMKVELNLGNNVYVYEVEEFNEKMNDVLDEIIKEKGIKKLYCASSLRNEALDQYMEHIEKTFEIEANKKMESATQDISFC